MKNQNVMYTVIFMIMFIVQSYDICSSYDPNASLGKQKKIDQRKRCNYLKQKLLYFILFYKLLLIHFLLFCFYKQIEKF